jgi:hypothetical protein
MCLRDVHLSKAFAPISSSPSPNVTLVIPEQSKNAQFLILLTALCMMMRCSDSHLSNACSPISFSPSPRVTVIISTHPLNAYFLILLTALGMMMRSSDEQY